MKSQKYKELKDGMGQEQREERERAREAQCEQENQGSKINHKQTNENKRNFKS